MKKIVLLIMVMSFSGGAVATNTEKFNQCVLSLLNASCNTAIDRGAPRDLMSQGIDSCFVGREVAPADSKEKKKFESYIEKRNFEMNKEQSDAIRKCVATPASLKSCTVPLIKATRDYYPVCKEALESTGKKRQKKASAQK